jgi:hypothetical protein
MTNNNPKEPKIEITEPLVKEELNVSEVINGNEGAEDSSQLDWNVTTDQQNF